MTLGIPIVTCGPGNRLIPHQVDEYVEVARTRRRGEDLRRLGSQLPRSRERSRLASAAVEAFPGRAGGRAVRGAARPGRLRRRRRHAAASIWSRSSRCSTASTRSPTSRPRSARGTASSSRASTSSSSSATLDEHGFLDSPRLRRRRRRDRRRRSWPRPRRPASHAGGAYADDPAELRARMDGFFTSPAGPGRGRAPFQGGGVGGLIAPHIDFHRGGPAYAWAYRDLAERGDADLFVIFGTCHAGMADPFALTRKDYDTPLGPARRRPGLRRGAGRAGAPGLLRLRAGAPQRALDRVPGGVPAATSTAGRRDITHRAGAHELRPRGARARAGGRRTTRGCGASSTRSARRWPSSGRRVAFIAGADLAHVGPRFGDPQPVEPGRARARSIARTARCSRAVEAGDADGFFESVRRDGDRRRICGLSPIYALLRVRAGRHGPAAPATASGPIPRASSPSPAWCSDERDGRPRHRRRSGRCPSCASTWTATGSTTTCRSPIRASSPTCAATCASDADGLLHPDARAHPGRGGRRAVRGDARRAPRRDACTSGSTTAARRTSTPARCASAPADVPYCAVKGGAFEARLSRAAAYQLLDRPPSPSKRSALSSVRMRRGSPVAQSPPRRWRPDACAAGPFSRHAWHVFTNQRSCGGIRLLARRRGRRRRRPGARRARWRGRAR